MISQSLDRRIKSRFLHRQIYTYLPKNVQQVQDIFTHYLTLPMDRQKNELTNDTTITDDFVISFNARLNECLSDKFVRSLLQKSLSKSNVDFYKTWMVCHSVCFMILTILTEIADQ